MPTWEDVQRIALELPETEERISRELRQWRVKDKLFVWERPLRRREIEALGAEAPDGPILGARVEHLGAKEALLADDPSVFFTTAHFDGHPSVLVRLDRIAADDLDEVIVEAWLARAPADWRRRTSTPTWPAVRTRTGSPYSPVMADMPHLPPFAAWRHHGAREGFEVAFFSLALREPARRGAHGGGRARGSVCGPLCDRAGRAVA